MASMYIAARSGLSPRAPRTCRRRMEALLRGVRVTDTLDIDELLAALGFDQPDAKRRARAALESAGLTRPGKRGIAAYKRPQAEAALAAALVRVCGRECAALAAAGRKPVISAGTTCEVCQGSNNRRAALACAGTLRTNGVRRVLVVGGTAQQQHDLAGLMAGAGLELQFVDGTRSHTQKEAIANMNRAQLAVIWGSTPLRHAVSNLYTDEPPPGLRVISVARRGIEALCREIIRSYAPRGARAQR